MAKIDSCDNCVYLFKVFRHGVDLVTRKCTRHARIDPKRCANYTIDGYDTDDLTEERAAALLSDTVWQGDLLSQQEIDELVVTSNLLLNNKL